VIGETGDSFRLYLGGGIATNGINCAMLGYSVADATLVTTGKASGAWEAAAMQAGLVTTGYAGGCLFAGPSPDGATRALLAGAELKFTTGFTGSKESSPGMPTRRGRLPASWTPGVPGSR
jgi:hypothetical protein